MRIMITEIGNKNSGDESICLSVARRFISLGSEVTFCYRVSLEESTKRAGLNVKHFYTPIENSFDNISNSRQLIKAFAQEMPELYDKMKQLLLDHDVVGIAPGGKFTDGYKNARTLLAAAMAQSLDLPVIVFHQSVGPIDNPNHLKLLVEVFSKSTLLLIRDDLSYNFLDKLGIPSNKIKRCRDLAMGESYPAPTGIDYDLGINIRTGANGHIDLDALFQLIKNYNSCYPDDRVLVYSTTYEIPQHVTDRISDLSVDIKTDMPLYPNYLKEVGRCAVNVSDSFHGCIFSMMADRPVICCQTDYKTWKLMGLPAPEQEPLEVLPGLVSKQEAKKLLDKVISVRNNPEPLRRYQRRIANYGRELCEKGWAAAELALKHI